MEDRQLDQKMITSHSQGGTHRFGIRARKGISAFAAFVLSMTTLVAGFIPATPAAAAPGDGVCYLIADSGGGNGGNDLLTIVDRGDFNPVTNETSIGTGTGTWNIEAMDMNPATLELWAADAGQLGRIDKLTGVFDSSGLVPFGTGTGALGSINIDDVDGLAFNYLTGELFGAQRESGNDLLVQIDITTGLIIQDAFGPGIDYLVSDLSAVPNDDIDDLAFHPITGELYGSVTNGSSGNLVLLDVATGVATDIGPFLAGDIEGMRFDAEGLLWGTSGTTPGELFEIDITDGHVHSPRTVDNGGDYESTVCYVPGSDLFVEKSVSDPTPYEGTNVTYTVSVFDAGPANATGVEVTDLLPAGVTYVSSTPSQGTYNDTTGLWTVGAIDRGNSATLDIVASVDAGTAGTTITNTAERTAVDQGDAVPNNDTASADIVPVAAADLAVNKTVSDPAAAEGDTVVYMVGVTNNGPTAATGVSLSDNLPAGVTFVSASASQGSYGGGTWTVGSLAAGASATLDITVTIDGGTALSTITNTASVSGSDQSDPDGSNNSASADINVPVAGLDVTKASDTAGPVAAGDTITYTVTIENTGGMAFTDLEINDSLPAATTYVAESTIATGWDGQTTSSSWSQQLSPNAAISTSCAAPNLITFPVATSLALTDINVGFTATHTWRGDIQVNVVSPAGTSVQLAPGAWNGHGQNNYDVIFDAQSTDPLNDGDNDNTSPPYDRSVGVAALANFVGEDTAGTWTVEVCDTYPSLDFGTVDSVELFFEAGGSGSTALTLDNVPGGGIGDLADGTPAALVTAADGFDLSPGETMTVVYQVQVDAQLDGSVTEIVNTAAITSNEFTDPVEASVTDPIDFAPELDIVKDGPAGPIAVGEMVTYTYTVTHTAASDGSPVDVTVTDDIVDLSAVTPTGDTDSDALLDGGETWVYTVNYTVPLGTDDPLVNVATASGTDLNGEGIPEDSDDHSVDVEFAPLLTVTKVGSPGPAVVGDTVAYTYTVSHDAASDLSPVSNVSVVDSRGLALSGPSGDINGNGLLDGSETWTYTATETVTATTPDPLTNDVAVNGTDRDGDAVPEATDSESIDIEFAPVIQVVKTGPATAEIGDTVTYSFAVSHDAASDGSPVTVTGVTDSVAGAATYVSGDDGNGLLESGEIWVYEATHTITATDADPLVNTVTVTSTDRDGDDLPDATDDHSTDIDHLPVIVIDKTGPAFAVAGDTVTYTFTVSHDPTSDGTPVSNLTVSDDVAGAATYVSGDDGDGLLESGETWVFEATYTIQATDPDPLANIGTATGDDEDGDPVTDDDTHTTDLINPAIQIDKSPDAQTIVTGSAATFTITVTNTGDADLTDVEVSDALAPACDNVIGDLDASASTSYTCSVSNVTADFTNSASVVGDHAAGGSVSDSDTADVVVIDPAISILKSPDAQTILIGSDATFTITVVNTGDSGLTNVVVSDSLAPACGGPIGDLAAGDSTSFVCSLTNVTADFTNTAAVTGDHAAGGSVSDSDTADVVVIDPAITLEKTPDLQQILSGGTADFTITVTNTGDADLTSVTVTDALAPACDNVIGALAAGASTSFTCSLANVTADFTNTAAVTGDHAAGGSVSDSDTAVVDVVDPAITITKDPATQQARAGDTVNFTITVENSGDVDLTDVTVTDAAAPACDNTIGALAAGVSTTYTCSMTAGGADFTNVADVTGEGPLGPVTDSDTASVDVIAPAVNIQKTPDVSTILSGADVTFTIAVENTGDVALTDVTVTDALTADCDATFATLAAGAVETYTCTAATVTADFTNVAEVAGDDPLGNPVTDTDDAVVDVIAPAIDIEKTPDSQTLLSGDDATFTVTVENTGDVELTDVTVTDALTADCDAFFATLAAGAVETYTCTAATVTADFTNVADVTADHAAGGAVTDTDSALVDVIGPAITIDKTPDSQQARDGDTVTFDITVTNTGDVGLTGVVVTDATAPACDSTIGALAAGASSTYSCSMTAGAADFTNTAAVTGDDPLGNPVTDSDTADVDVINPAISINKTPNSQQARDGDTVLFTITVTNSGDVDLTGVAVSDVVAPACDNTIGALAAGASTTYSCSMTAGAADFTNTAAVTGDDPLGNPVTDSDTADVDVINPTISIEKTPDSQQARDGDTVLFTITVTNSGDVDLTGIAVTDVVAPACDNTIGALAAGASTTYSCSMTAGVTDFTNTAAVVGDDPLGNPLTDSDSADVDVINPSIAIDKTPDSQQAVVGTSVTFDITVTNTGDVGLTGVAVTDAVAPDCDNTIGALAAGASTTYSCSMTAGVTDFTNTAAVAGDDPLGNPVTDSDEAFVDVFDPGISIDKTPDSQQARDGDTVTFDITVTNTGDVNLTGVTVSDVVAPACDNSVGALAAGASTSYSCTMTAGASDFTNTADVTGNDPLGNPVTDNDSADVDVIAPAITIDKTPDSQQAHDGDTVTFDITVTNTGDVGLTGVVVTDAVAPDCDSTIGALAAGASTGYSCTMTAGAADFTNTAAVTGDDPLGNPVTDSDSADVDVIAPAITIGKTPDSQQAHDGDTVTFNVTVTNSGDVDLIGVTVTDAVAPSCNNTIGALAAGASTSYSCSMTAGAADFTNTAAVTGNDPTGDPVTDSDTADVDVINPGIDIQKTPDTQQARDGDTVTFTITVANTGDVTLTDVTVTDLVASNCDNSFASLAAGAIESYTCTMNAGASDFTNTADVTGDDPLGDPVTDSDTADVDVIDPAITIEKTPDSQQARDGDTVTFDITVTNTGDVDLVGVTVTDAVAPDCDSTIGALAAGASTGYSCTMTAGAADFTNTAAVTGDDPLGNPVTDSDSADVDVIAPAITIEKTPDSQQARDGDTVTFDITVTNTGDVALTDVTVTDAVAPDCDNTIGALGAGASTSYSCSMTAGASDFTNTADVTGDDPLGSPVTDSDSADVDVISPAITITKDPATQQVLDGATVTFDITVTNNGDVDLTGVTVTDVVAPACDNTIGALAAGASTSYSCSMTAGSSDFTNTADVTGDDPLGNPVTDSDDADVDVVNPGIDIQKTPDNQQVLANGTATFTITVTNTGDVDLTAVAVTDAAAPGCDDLVGDLAVGISTSYNCSLANVSADFTNTAVAVGSHAAGGTVTDSDTADVDVIGPAIDIQKTPDGQQAQDGDTVTFDITVTNSGDVTLTGVTVTDAVAPACDNNVGVLAAGASTSYSCTMTAGATDFTNTAAVAGDDPLGNPVVDSDSADVDVIDPSIAITKDPASQQARGGDTVTFTISVTNTGDVDLVNVAVTDAVAPSCDSAIGGLAAGASTTYSCSMTAGAADFTNTAAVTGDDPQGNPVTDSDDALVDIINPGIDIQKTPDTQQAVAGATVTFDITVTNTGDVDLVNVAVTDAVAPSCDSAIGGLAAGASTTYSCSMTAGAADFTNTAAVTGNDPLGNQVTDSDDAAIDVVNPAIDIAKNPASQTLLGGDTATFTITVTNLGDVPLNNVVVTDPQAPDCDATYPTLAVGTSDSYTCSLANVTADFTNVAVVAGEHPAAPGPITDSDVADVEVIAPEIDIQKTPDTQTVATGSDVTFTITVENTGDTGLTNVVVTDALAPTCSTTFAALAIGEVQTFTCTVSGVTADFTNTADVVADEPAGGTVSDSDTADVDVIDPSITIDKTPDTQTVLPGGDATFTITVENTGDVDLVDVTITDAQAPACDAFYPVLAAGASDSYTCTLPGVGAGFTNVANVTGDDPLGNPVTDSDTADVVMEAPAIEIVKTADAPTVVSGGDATFTITVTNTGTTPLSGVAVTDTLAPNCDATIGDLAAGASSSYSCTVVGVTADFTNTASVVGTHPFGGTVSDDDSADVDVIAPTISITKDPATQQVLAGQDATFTITVENTGDVDLTGVAVTDALAPVCDSTIGALAVGQVVTYTCDVTVVTDFTNTASVVGLDPLGDPVSDSDDAVVDVIAPDIQIEKTPDLQSVVTGDDATFTITVTNTGDVDLTGVTVTDALAPACDATIGGLAAGASTSYTCIVTGVTTDFTNNAAVSGLDPLNNAVSDDDDAVVDVIDPSISLTKDPATQQILSGQDANFTITVTNTGDSPLTNVTITDALAPDCDAVIPALGAGASTTVNCTAPAVTSSFTNTASVVATHAAGGTVNDSDTAGVEVLVPAVDIQKTPDLQVAGIGDTVTFDITVTNAGVIPLSNVTVTDALAPNCDATIGDLAVSGTSTYSCTLTVTADLTNTAVVDATDAVGNPATDSDTADVDVVAPAVTIEKTPDNQSVVLNDTPTFTITVTNTGDIDLTNVVVTDALAPACDATFASLAVGANETYTCDGTATAADFTNTASVTADSVVGSVGDSDTADVNVLVPAIDIQKTPDNQLVGPAGMATFTITVTNAGATPLTDVTVSDPLAPSCDATFASLPVGGVETYTCDVFGVSGDFTNTVSVTGADPLNNLVTDSDTADVDFVDPAISIEKTPDLQTLLAGEDASFTITVTNTGDTDLTNVVITDPLATGCEATFAVLAMGASETVTCDVTAVAADFTNVASVTADTPIGTQVSDSDDALVDVVAPGVQIEKTPDIQQIHSGDDVTFTITVTNNGDQDLVDLTVTDALTPACDTTIAALAIGESTSYDCTATGVTDDFTNIAAVAGADVLGNPVSDSDDAAVDVIDPAIDIQKTPDAQAVVVNGTATFDITITNTGDVDLTGVTVSDPAAPACDNVIGTLAVGASATYSCSLSGVAGDFTNTASVTGNDPLDAPVTDSDTADVTVLVPAIDIQKTPDLQQARAGDTVDFSITVTNAGATPLTDVTVTDVMAPACDTVIGDLAVGESTTFTCSMTAGAADFTNTADVAGDDPFGNPVTDSDTADVDIIGPSISIEKSPDGQTVVTGGTATFTIEVTNTGDVDLSGVAVSDAAVPACDGSIGDLAVGESTSYTCSVSDVTADFTNTADVTGTDPIGETVTDSDTADVAVLVPGIDIQKTPDTQTVVEGDDATFTIIVTNTGQTDLFNVTVSDPLAPACDRTIGDLPVGSAPLTYTCTAAAAASFTNTATVDAVDPLDNPVNDSDIADVVALVRSNINGTIAHDIAGDGAIDGGDLGLGGVDVTATWAGLDGVFGTADDEVFTTTTDGSGDYSFDLVPPGEFQIDVDTADLPFGVDFQTLDPDAVLDSSTTLTLPEDTTYPDVDFAYTATGSIGDLVWLDLNDDGVQDAGEPGLGGIGVTVTWLGPDGVPGGGDDLVFTTTTAPGGSYLVDGLPAGEFTVVIDGIPAGLSGDLDQTVTLGAAEARDDVDFPLVGTASIGDQVFADLDHDGVFDSGEPGVAGVTVGVTWAGPDGVIGSSDDVVFTTVTGGSGQYLVGGLPAGGYLVEIDETTIPADLGTAPPVTVSLPGGGSDLTADFPLVGNRPPVAVDDEDVTDENTPVVITVLDDDSDPDGHSFAVSSTTDPDNGSIVVNPDGTITYTPNPGFVGVDTFTYTICELDGVVNGIPATGLCDTATVTVTIVEVNDPPGPEASFQTVVVGSPVDPMPVFDPDGGPVTVTFISGELPPGITLNPDGTFNGVTTEIGTYQIVVQVCDDDTPQMCIIHTHTIAVTPVTLPGPDDPDPETPPDTLPFTGANFGELLMAALAMLMAGAGLVLLSRKRAMK